MSNYGRFKAPFVMKVHFYPPSKINQGKNKGHVAYIGLRPGVAFEETPAGHMQYAGERPRSHGLFSSEDGVDMTEVQKELEQHEGVVWRYILSLREEDAARLDLIDRQRWVDTIRASVHDAAENMGIGYSNLRWVAAYHQEKGHPHVHLLIWENPPKRRLGRLTNHERKQIRKAFMKEIYGDERVRLNQERTATRDLIREMGLNTASEASKLLREIRVLQKDVEAATRGAGVVSTSIPRKLYNEDAKMLMNHIYKVSEMMPRQGRLAFKLMPQEVKSELQNVSRLILNMPAIRPVVDQHLETTAAMSSMYTANAGQIQKAVTRAKEDLEIRVAQVVLRAAAESRKLYRQRVVPKNCETFLDHFYNAKSPPEDRSDITAIKYSVTSLRKVGLPIEKQEHLLNALIQYSGFTVSNVQLRKLLIETNSDNENNGSPSPHELKVTAFLMARFDQKISADVIQMLQDSGATKEEIEQLSQVNDDPLSHVKKEFRIRSDHDRTISSLSIVLAASGLSKNEIVTTIDEYRKATGWKIDDEQFNKSIDKGLKRIDENRRWGRNHVLSKVEFSALCASLKIDSPYLWTGRERSSDSLALVSNMWNSVWKSVERTRNQSEAKARLMSAEIEHEEEMKRRRDQQR